MRSYVLVASSGHWVWNAYLGALGRVPDQTVAGTSETEKAHYARQLDDAAATAGGREAVIDKAQEIAAMLFNSTEYTSITRTDEQYVRDLYEVYLQRAPDTAGLAQYTTAAGASGGRASVLNTFAGMTAFRELAGTIYREVNWIVTDHLGTPRMVVDRAGSLAGVKRHDYLPFGEEIGVGVGGRTGSQGYGQPNTLRERWATYERDDETGLDFAQARYYSSTQGRFTSPDEFTGGPEELFDFVDDAADNPTFYADLADPQSLNKYQYTYNNPLAYNDPTGHCPTCPSLIIITPKTRETVSNILISVGKVAANIVTDMANAGNYALEGDKYKHLEHYQAEGAVQRVTMHAAEVATIISPLAGKAPPVGVMAAEGRVAARTTAAAALEQVAAKELSGRFVVTRGRDISKTQKMADFIGVSRSGKSAVVQEVTTGDKSISTLRKQLENGIRHLTSRGFTGRIQPIVRTTNSRFAAQVRRDLPTVRGRDVKVIVQR